MCDRNAPNIDSRETEKQHKTDHGRDALPAEILQRLIGRQVRLPENTAPKPDQQPNRGKREDQRYQSVALLRGLKSERELNWRSKCSGKRLFRDLQERYRIKLSPAAFKETMIQSLAASKSETWRLLESIVSDALRSAP